MQINLDAEIDITYKESYVAFLDVLGFKNMVFSQDNAKLKQYFGVVNSVIEYLKDIEAKRNIGSIIISDSIILTVPHGRTKEENIEILRSLCIAVGLIQQNLALKDIWLRGAISSGKTYFNSNNNQIVGPAYINAYLLEEKLAIHPRVILDSKIITELGFSTAMDFIQALNQSDSLYYTNWGKRILFNWNSLPPQNRVDEIKQDVPLFIDYLSSLFDKTEKEKILRIVGNIEANIYKDVNIYKKYRWVTDYFKTLLISAEFGHAFSDDEISQKILNL